MKKVGKIILPIIIFLFCFISISDYQLCIVNNSFMFLIITYYVFFYFKKYTKNVQNIIFSIFATLCFLLGREYMHCNAFIQNLNIQNIILLFLQGLIIFFIVLSFINILQNKDAKIYTSENIFQKLLNKNQHLKLFIIILICWIPYILISYASYFSWDAAIQLSQYLHIFTNVTKEVTTVTNPQYITTHHSVLYTYLLGWFSKIVDVNIGIYIFNILEILFIIYSIVSVLFFVNKYLTCNKILSWICIFICIYPSVPRMFSFIMKDNMFFATTLCCCIELYKMLKNENCNMIKFILFMILSILLRNNMVYVFVVYFLILLFCMKENRKRCTIILSFILITIVGSNAIYHYLGITKGSRAEMLSVPFQQTARVVKEYNQELTNEEKETINRVLNYDKLEEVYEPTISDPVKATFNERKPTNKELIDFLKIWIKLFEKHPLTCLEATINNQIGNLYPFYTADMHYMNYARDKIIVEDNQIKYNINWCFDLRKIGYVYQSNLAEIAFLFDKTFNYFCLIPIVGSFTIGTVYIWIYLYAFLIAIKKKNKSDIFFLIFFLFYLGTVFLGPCGAERHFRYIYPIYGCTPIFYLIFSKYRKTKGYL